MSGRAKITEVLSAVERDRAKQIGAGVYGRSRRYRLLREKHVYAALDAAVASMEKLKFPNPYDGRILGALATVLIENDTRAIGYLRNRKIAALNDLSQRDELFVLAGKLVAEDFLKARKDQIPAEPRLTLPDGLLGGLDDLFVAMSAAGEEMAKETVLKGEMSVTFTDGSDPADIARALIEDVIGSYESLIPEIDDNDQIPERVQARSLAKAAFLRLGVDDLGELATSEGYEDLPTKEAMARALSEKYSSDLDEVARLVIRRQHGDPEYGLITRVLPLRSVVDLDAAEEAFIALRGRYLEPRTALFFIFGDVTRNDKTLRIKGTIRSFTVNPDEAGGRTQVNFRTHNDQVQLMIRAGIPWVEANTRRASDLGVIRGVLRRTGVIDPAAAVPVPDPVTKDPYSAWDPRTLWMLDFLRRELQAPELKLDDTLMANFMSPKTTTRTREEAEDEQRRPNVDAVRLLGRQLHEHPESCQRIAGLAHLRDIEVRVRQVLNQQAGTSRLVRFRLSWDDDHLAVMSGLIGGSDNDEQLDADVHRKVVGLVRDAAGRPLDEAGLDFTLRQIAKKAAGDQDEGSVFADEADSQTG